MDFVDCAYGAALEPDRWPSALDRLGNHLGHAALVLRVQNTGSNKVRFLGSANIQDQYLNEFGEAFGDPDANPFVRKVVTSPLGATVMARTCVADHAYRRSRLYRQFYRPQNLFHAMEVPIERLHGDIAILNLAWPPGGADFSPDTLSRLEQAMPHLRRALRLSSSTDDRGTEKVTKDLALDRLALAVFAVTSGGRLMWSNRAAERLLQSNEGLSHSGAGLFAETSRQTLELRQLINRVARGHDQRHAGSPDALLLARSSSESPLFVLAVAAKSSIREGASSDEANDEAPVLLFVSDPLQQPEGPPGAYKTLFGLTRSEARLAKALVAGKTLAEAAGDFGIKRGTARVELSCIFSKTGTHRQSELIKLLLRTCVLSNL